MTQNNQENSRTQKREYWCFISYRHLDNKEEGRQWATWLHQSLETYEVPEDLVGTVNERGEEIPSRIFPVFRDEEELPADAELSNPIERALKSSKFMVVICSPNAVASKFVDGEIRAFKKIGKADRVLAMIISGEPNASEDECKNNAGTGPDAECFPKSLRRVVDKEGTITDEMIEPVGADFRLDDGSEGWTSPGAYLQHLHSTEMTKQKRKELVQEYAKRCELMKLKIIAGIIGVPVGVLTNREKSYQLEKERKKAKALRIWLIIVTFAAILAIGASIFAFLQWREAERQKIQAFRTTEEVFTLVEHLSDDMFEKLTSAGKLDILNGFLVAIGQFFAERSFDIKEAFRGYKKSEKELELEWTHYLQYGAMDTANKEFDKAERDYKCAEEIAQEMIIRKYRPSNYHYWGGYGIAFGHAKVDPLFLTYLNTAELNMHEVIDVIEKYGEGYINSSRGRFTVEEKPKVGIKKLLKAIEDQQDSDKKIDDENVLNDNQQMIAHAMNTLALTQLHMGNLDEAKKNAAKALELLKAQRRKKSGIQLIIPIPQTFRCNSILGDVRVTLGDICLKQKNYYDSEKYYQNAIECFKAAFKIEQNVKEAYRLAFCYFKLANVFQEDKKYHEAQEFYQQALQLTDQLCEDEKRNVSIWNLKKAVNQGYCWNCCFLSMYTEAVTSGEQTISILKALDADKRPGGVEAFYSVNRPLAHAYLLSGNRSAAEKIYKKYLNTQGISAKQWIDDVKEDFIKLKEAGVNNTELQRIEEILKPNYLNN